MESDDRVSQPPAPADKLRQNLEQCDLDSLAPPPDTRQGRGYKNFSIVCLRQDVRTHAVTHEILNTFNVNKDKYKDKYKDKDKDKVKKLFNIVSSHDT